MTTKAKSSNCDKGGSHTFHTIRYCAICLENAYDEGYEQGKKDACKRIRHVLIDDDYLDQRISFFEWLADYEKGKELSKDG